MKANVLNISMAHYDDAVMYRYMWNRCTKNIRHRSRRRFAYQQIRTIGGIERTSAYIVLLSGKRIAERRCLET